MKFNCQQCGTEFEAGRRDAKFCSVKCRVNSVRGKVPTSDVNALARGIILSKVPTKKTEEDSIDARLKRLEQAMKQFASKKKAQP